MALVKYQKSPRELRNQLDRPDRAYDKKRQGGTPDVGAADDEGQAENSLHGGLDRLLRSSLDQSKFTAFGIFPQTALAGGFLLLF